MSPMWGAREKEKNEKNTFRKCGFFVVCPYGSLCHPCGGQGRRKKTKKTRLENVGFSWFACAGAREEEKNEGHF